MLLTLPFFLCICSLFSFSLPSHTEQNVTLAALSAAYRTLAVFYKVSSSPSSCYPSATLSTLSPINMSVVAKDSIMLGGAGYALRFSMLSSYEGETSGTQNSAYPMTPDLHSFVRPRAAYKGKPVYADAAEVLPKDITVEAWVRWEAKRDRNSIMYIDPKSVFWPIVSVGTPPVQIIIKNNGYLRWVLLS